MAALAAAVAGCSADAGTTGGGATERTGGRFPAPERTTPTRVTEVIDGDTVKLAALGSTRLIGVDTPEVYGGVECYGRAASAFTKSVLRPGRRVRYRLGLESRDRYGRALAYVWLTNGTFFNGLLAERGFGAPLTIPPNDDYAPLFVAAARRARRAERGLWSSAACAGENEPSLEPPAAGGSSSGGCGRFRTHDEAQAWWISNGRPGGLDGDGDGQVCEDLP